MPDEPSTPKPEVVDLLLAAALAAYPGEMGEEGAARVREHTERLRLAAATLDAYHLENADEPDATFRAISGMDHA
jgi:hypothetical protein